MPPERPLAPSPSPAMLDLVDTVARAVARVKKLPSEDTEHFARSVRASMSEWAGAPDWDFDGRASFRTYLTIVVTRQLKASEDDDLADENPGTPWVS